MIIPPTKLLISFYNLVFCLACLLLLSLGCDSITVTVHLLSLYCMTCLAYFHLSFNCCQDYFNFGLVINPSFFLPFLSCHVQYYYLHAIVDTLKFSFQDFCNTSGFRSICTDNLLFSLMIIGDYFSYNCVVYHKHSISSLFIFIFSFLLFSTTQHPIPIPALTPHHTSCPPSP